MWAADRSDQLINCLISERTHLIVGAVLYRVFNEQSGRVETQSF